MRPQASLPTVRRRPWQRGGAVLAVMAGLLVVAASTLAIRMARQVEDKTAQQQLTLQRMQRVGQALQAYALVHGCPLKLPDGGAMGNSSLGDAVAGGTTVPWRTLGIAREDALDAWGRKISYLGNIAGVKVNVFGANENADWALVSHGPSGLGAWLPGEQKMPAPGNADELTNANPSSPLQLKQENAGTHVQPANLFDDFLVWGSLDVAACPPLKPLIEGAPPSLNLTKALLNTLSTVKYSARDTKESTIKINGGTALGKITITSSGGNISANDNSNGTAIGVCEKGCGNDKNSSLSGTKTLSFKLDEKAAEKFALGLLSLVDTVQFSVKFRYMGVDLSTYVSPVVPVDVGDVKIFPNLVPSPALPFDEVVIQALNDDSSFFIASIRFCAVDEICD
ncbi:MAG TPA: hypothetical protein DET46_11450 [Comamonadaceae bacterium]|nr:MAG: hypothetical protein A3F76_03240 [Burkholderiales bacterium RIFCSPLOWO2_12_FULL_65_40]HCE29274.1 hypothetical protein [Comamonadaceae bacterium]